MVKHTLQFKTNSVKEGVPIKEEFSLSKADHEPHVVADPYPATVHNKTKTRFACWDVRTMYQCGKLENIKLEMERLKLDLLGVCEGIGDFCSDNYSVIYSCR